MGYLPGNEAAWAMYHRSKGILLASSNFGQRQLVMKNQPGDLSQSETAKCLE